jgi:hypothetical protein
MIFFFFFSHKFEEIELNLWKVKNLLISCNKDDSLLSYMMVGGLEEWDITISPLFLVRNSKFLFFEKKQFFLIEKLKKQIFFWADFKKYEFEEFLYFFVCFYLSPQSSTVHFTSHLSFLLFFPQLSIVFLCFHITSFPILRLFIEHSKSKISNLFLLIFDQKKFDKLLIWKYESNIV